MASWDSLIRMEGMGDVQGPASINAVLADAVAAPGYEGFWVPWWYVKSGSIEVSGSMSTLSVQLAASNLIEPLNAYGVTIGGTVTTSDVTTLTVTTPAGVRTPSYTSQAGNAVSDVAAGLAAAINADAVLRTQRIRASAAAAVVTLTWPSPPPTSGAVAPLVTVSGASGGAATESVAVAVGTTGTALGAPVTTLGITQMVTQCRWLKARIGTLTGGGARITVAAQGTA